MKKALALLLVTLAVSACVTATRLFEHDYPCTEFNAALQKINTNPKYRNLDNVFAEKDLARFMHINYIRFRSVLGSQPHNLQGVMKVMDDGFDLQAVTCRVAPQGIMQYTLRPQSSLFITSQDKFEAGFGTSFKGGLPTAVEEANKQYGTSTLPNEAGMEVVKAYLLECLNAREDNSRCNLQNVYEAESSPKAPLK